MPGYKVLVRWVLIIGLVAVIGLGIYFIVSSFTNKHAAYNSYKDFENSKEVVYFRENFSEGTEAFVWAETYAMVQGHEFSYIENCYFTENIMYERFTQKLYFSNSSVKGDLPAKFGDLKQIISECNVLINNFLTKKHDFEKEESEGGSDLTPEEKQQLKGLIDKVAEKFFAELQSMNILNNSLKEYVQKYCVVQSEKSLEHAMLSCMLNQTTLLLDCIKNTTASSINYVWKDNNKSIEKFNQAKSTNFEKQTDVDSDEFKMLSTFNDLTDQIKTEFFKSYDKKMYVDTSDSRVKIKLTYVLNVMGWGDY